MTAGLIFSADSMRLTLSTSASHFGTTLYGSLATGRLISRVTADSNTLATGIEMISTSDMASGGAITTTYRLIIPALGVDTTVTHSGAEAMDQVLEFADWRLYCFNGLFWRVSWSGVTWKINGTTEWSAGAGHVDSLPGYLTPASIPLLGCPVELIPGASSQLSFSLPPALQPGTNFESGAESDVSGGWDFSVGGAWHALPVSVVLGTPESGCSCSTPTLPEPTATTTANGSVSAYGRTWASSIDLGEISCPCPPGSTGTPSVYHEYNCESGMESWGSAVVLVPNLSKAVERMGADYRAFVYRGAMPKVSYNSQLDCMHEAPCDTDCTTYSSTTEAFPRQGPILEVVTNSAAALEDTFGYATIAPYTRNASRYVSTGLATVLVTEGTCSIGSGGGGDGEELGGGGSSSPPICWDPTVTFCGAVLTEQLKTVETRDDYAALTPILDFDPTSPSADDYLARYINSWANPHWNFGLWFPPDGSAATWNLMGSPVNSSDYWLPLGSQYTHNTVGGITDNRRSDVISEPLFESALTGWQQSYLIGAQTCWWGNSRFKAQTVTPADYQYTSASSPLWTLTGCTAVFGATIDVDPASGSCVIELDLGSFAQAPYMLPHICDSIACDWTADVHLSVAVYVVDVSGRKVPLTDTPSATPVTLPNDVGTKYAGSWAQEFGQRAISDAGTDSKSRGVSAATMSDAERVFAFQLGRGRTWAKLRYELTVTDDTLVYHLKYPKLFVPVGDCTVINESRQQRALIWADGPGVRHGNWAWWDTVLLSEPEVWPPGDAATGGWMSSALDWLCWANIVLRGLAPGTNLATDISTLYDSTELGGVSLDNDKYQQADEFTTSYIVQATAAKAGIGVMVNSLAECPPLCHFPSQTRNTATWQPNGAYSQVAYSHCQGPRRYVSSDSFDLAKPDGTVITSADGATVSSWVICRHDVATLNDEGDTYKIVLGGSTWAHASPWHGYFWIPGDGSAFSGLFYDVALDQTHFTSWVSGGTAWVGRSQNASPNTIDAFDTGIMADLAVIRVAKTTRDQQIGLLVVNAGDIKLYLGNRALTFTMAISIGSGPYGMLHWSRDRRWWVYWLDGTDIKGAFYDAALNLIDGPFTAISGVDSDAGFDLHDSGVSGGGRRIGIFYSVGGARVIKTSTDGKIFV